MPNEIRSIQLREDDWRIVHNALAVYQVNPPTPQYLRARIQLLMNIVRDQAIAPTNDTKKKS